MDELRGPAGQRHPGRGRVQRLGREQHRGALAGRTTQGLEDLLAHGLELLAELAQREEGSLVLHVSHPDEDKRDVAGARVRKFFERLRDELRRADFSVVDAGWDFSFGEDSVLWYVLEPARLPAEYEREGPPLDAQEHVERFEEEVHAQT